MFFSYTPQYLILLNFYVKLCPYSFNFYLFCFRSFFFIETFFFDIIPQFFVDREFNFIIFSCFSSMG